MPRITSFHREAMKKAEARAKKSQSRTNTNEGYEKPYNPAVQTPAHYQWYGYDGPDVKSDISPTIKASWAVTNYQLFGQAIPGDDTWYQIVMTSRGTRYTAHPYYVNYGGERFYFVKHSEASRFVENVRPANPRIWRAT